MAKPETSLIAGIHRHLPPKFHWEKMHNPYRGGTADCWYSGAKSDLWIEYKFVLLPARDDTLIPIKLEPLQVQWLQGRLAEGRDVAVVVGCKEGCALFTGREWLTPVKRSEFVSLLSSRKSLATWILSRTGGPP